ncbi:hypothetical protein BVC93_24430 [Mycobacterium sp. MS1601]|uniref:hypothetical protein n=1 Tax=Mycobacterium sp. MS1601 TaxID=1936029 RepID=UPI0009798164|nr:hypothetical protein [Mycobacterium sp. MS1601]AQA05029.1 hypothetical protein BVC93_24430 [Mycobacterium sp. MS1601]
MTATEDVIRAAASVGRDAAEGKLDPAGLDAAVATECKALFGAVTGEGDPLFAVQVDVARQVLAVGGIPATEVAEWAAVLKRRAGAVEPIDGAGAPGGPDVPAETKSSASGPHSLGSGDADAETEADSDQ